MDSRESHHHQQHHHQIHHPQGMNMAPPLNSYNISNNNGSNNNNINPNPNPSHSAMMNNPFNSVSSINNNSQQQQYSDGGSSAAAYNNSSIEPARKKRGRPRKYSPDGSIAAGVAPAAPAPVAVAPISTVGHGDSGGGGGETSAKRSRGRPPGSGKKQLDALGAPGVGFTPHVITVKMGEDISARIMAFSEQGPRTVCILSANGAISNVTLRRPAMSGGTVTLEGRFEIISLSGSYSPSESNSDGSQCRPGGLSVSLAGSDGRVLGGGVAGMLIAATPVQVVVGSFIADGKKPKSGPVASTPSPNMLNFGGGPTQGISPPSEGALSESSDDSGSSPFNRGPEPYNNANPQIQNIPMYGWPSNTMNMFPN
ncbi:hypothetical protein LguiB_028563 [Lonicera macranthoides]